MLASFAAGWTTDQPLLAIVAGLVLLVGGAELLVRGAVWIALALGMSRMAVGLTLVALGTSLPEMLVSLTAARTGRSAIAMANVIGSNTANVLLIVGCAAAIRAIQLKTRWLELGYMLLATALAAVPFVYGRAVDRPLAAVMVTMLVLFCWQLLARERAATKLLDEEPPPPPSLTGWIGNVALLAGGLLLLAYGAEWLVEGAASIALSLGMSEALVGMTIVAVGTSLPELATSVVAALRGQPEICIGNVVGSNIFNVGAVLGGAGLIQPFPVEVDSLLRLMVVTAASALAMVLVLRLRHGVSRLVGILFLLAYAGFMAFEISIAEPA